MRGLGQQLVELRVLMLQLQQALRLRHLKTAEIGIPLEKGRTAYICGIA